jgi:predicted ArsR family transcriptional regulator
MLPVLSDNPTREKIIMLLKRGGPQSIEQLSKELHITSMGIRQHLLSLERKGLIDYLTKRQGIGRPAFLYKLTDKADELFPKGYDQFALNMLKDIERNEGREKIAEIFTWQRTRLLKDAKEALDGKSSTAEKLEAFSNFLGSSGYISRIEEGEVYSLRVFNCPVSRVAVQYRDICQNDLAVLQEIFGKDVLRTECMSEGNAFCSYTIPRGF